MAKSFIDELQIDTDPRVAGHVRNIIRSVLDRRMIIKHRLTRPEEFDWPAARQFVEKLRSLEQECSLVDFSGITREELLETYGCGHRKCELAINALTKAGCSLYCPQPSRCVTIEEIEAMSQFC